MHDTDHTFKLDFDKFPLDGFTHHENFFSMHFVHFAPHSDSKFDNNVPNINN